MVKGVELSIFVDLAHFDEKKLTLGCPIPSKLWSTRPGNFELQAMATNKEINVTRMTLSAILQLTVSLCFTNGRKK